MSEPTGSVEFQIPGLPVRVNLAGELKESIRNCFDNWLDVGGEAGRSISASIRRRRELKEKLHGIALKFLDRANGEGVNLPIRGPDELDRWAKGVSDLDDYCMHKQWAALLASSTEKMEFTMYCDFLERLGGREARWLQRFWTAYGSGGDFPSLHEEKLQFVIKLVHSEIVRNLGSDTFPKIMFRRLRRSGLILSNFRYDFPIKEIWWFGRSYRTDSITWNPRRLTAELLRHVGVLSQFEIADSYKYQRREYDFAVRILTFNRVGFQFMNAIDVS